MLNMLRVLLVLLWRSILDGGRRGGCTYVTGGTVTDGAFAVAY